MLKFQKEQSSTRDINALENQYLKGQIYGEQETLKKFTLLYEPFVEVSEGIFKKSAVSGYQLQMYFNGLPLGDPTRRVIKKEEKFKEENMKYLIEQVYGTIQKIVEIATPAGIPVKIATKVLESKRAKKK
jgi:hypothetical protein